MSLLEEVEKGNAEEIVDQVADKEPLSSEELRKKLLEGKVVIPLNDKRDFPPIGIGEGLTTKVNANLGTSKDKDSIDFELKKLRAALDAGTDTVMDLSTGGDLEKIRKKIIDNSPVPLGTVPIYETSVRVVSQDKPMIQMTPDEIFDTIEEQAKQGVDFITVHCGVTMKVVEMLYEKKTRLIDIVSRGGSFLVEWIHYNEKENPLYAQFDRLLDIAKKYELTLSLGDGLRPGAIDDATDRLQIMELTDLGTLVSKAREAGVQAIVEGPGHVPVDEIEMNIKLQKSLCDDAPFYVLGPIVTDIAPGYDHITAAIGGAMAASYGADFLCYVTRAEHLALPDIEAVKEGVYATRIAAHAGDIAKGIPGAKEWDNKISKARNDLDWEEMISLALNKNLAEDIRGKSSPEDEDVCSMCGEFCALKKIGELRRKE